MSRLSFLGAAPVVVLLGLYGDASAQSIGYADAIDRFAIACSNDIQKHCAKLDLGGGRIAQCLDQNRAKVSASCTATAGALASLLATRAQARASVLRLCDVDIRRLCQGIEPGDGNLMECFYKAKQNVSSQCRQAVANAGYEVAIAPLAPTTQIALTSTELIDSLQGVNRAAAGLSAARLRQLASASITDPSRTQRLNRAPLVADLTSLAQLTIAIQFDFDSARIRPDSFRALGLMADALYHPYLQGYRFLIVGHTDGKGNREYNLKLSQLRAEAIRNALINPFGINPSRIEAVGLGEEQFLKPDQPGAADNRRVQLINIGPR